MSIIPFSSRSSTCHASAINKLTPFRTTRCTRAVENPCYTVETLVCFGIYRHFNRFSWVKFLTLHRSPIHPCISSHHLRRPPISYVWCAPAYLFATTPVTNPCSAWPGLETRWTQGTSAADVLQEAIPTAKVAKIFNTVGSKLICVFCFLPRGYRNIYYPCFCVDTPFASAENRRHVRNQVSLHFFSRSKSNNSIQVTSDEDSELQVNLIASRV